MTTVLRDSRSILLRWVSTNETLQSLTAFFLNQFPKTSHIFLVGSTLRLPFFQEDAASQDIDLVVDGISCECLKRLPDSHINFFGGVTFRFGGRAVDIWPLSETYHIRQFKLDPTVESFVRGAPFNLDKIALDLVNGAIFDDGFLAGIDSRRIVYAPLHPYLESIQAARCVLMKRKTSYELDQTAVSLLSRVARTMQRDPEVLASIRQFIGQAKKNISVDQVLEEIRGLGGVGVRNWAAGPYSGSPATLRDPLQTQSDPQ